MCIKLFSLSFLSLSYRPLSKFGKNGERSTCAGLMTSRRWRLPLLLSGFILFLQAFPIASPVRDAATLQWASEVFSMHYPLWHVVWTPFCGVADALTVLSYHQGIATAVWTIAFLLVSRRRAKILPHFILLLLFIAWGALIPRPMGRLGGLRPECSVDRLSFSYADFS